MTMAGFEWLSGIPAEGEMPATLTGSLVRNAQVAPGHVAFRERQYGIWQEWTTVETLGEVLALAAGLESYGLGAGQALTVIGDNRAAIYFAMLAAAALKAFPSPVFPDVPADDLGTYMRCGDPRIALAEDQEQVDKLLEMRAKSGRPEVIIYDDPRGIRAYTDEGLIALEDVRVRGLNRLEREPGLAADLVRRAGADDICVLLYSSGTTGAPKGIPLRHRNVVGGVRNGEKGGYFSSGSQLFAYLPTAWVGDYVFSLGAGVVLRATVNIPEKQETALHDLRDVAPNFYLAAPRAWDAMLTRVQVGIADSTPLKRRLFDYFMPKAVEMERRRLAGGQPSLGDRITRRFGEFFVYGPIKDYLGMSRAASVFTGGEAIGEDTFLFFRALGIPLKQFYGQTETCALTAAQKEGRVKLVGVGDALPGVEIKVADDGEILVKSVSVFDGYYDDPASTAKALQDGWLRTGDAGHVDTDGQIVVLGRVSEVVHTSNGERFIPNFIENRLKFSSFVRNVAVVGAGRPELTALVCIDPDAVGHWAEQKALSYTSYADLSQKPEVYELIAGVIAHVNSTLPEPLRIRRFANLPKDFDPDDGEVTRTRKLRRNVIEATYAPVIDALYDGRRSVDYEAAIAYEDGTRGTLKRTLMVREVNG